MLACQTVHTLDAVHHGAAHIRAEDTAWTQRKRALTPRLLEVQDVAVLLEHVNLLDTGDGGDAKLLESSLELDVAALLSGSRLLDDFASEGGLAAC